MIRHTRIGEGTVQVLEGVLHDPVGAAQVVQLLERFDPPRVHTDAAPWVWDRVAAGVRRRDPVEDSVLRHAAVEGVRPYALYEGLAQWARASGADVSLLAGHMPPPRRRDVRRAVSIIRREGLASATPRGLVDELRSQVLPRVPGLHAWHAERAGAVTKQMRSLFSSGGEGVAVLTYPDGPMVAELAARRLAAD